MCILLVTIVAIYNLQKRSEVWKTYFYLAHFYLQTILNFNHYFFNFHSRYLDASLPTIWITVPSLKMIHVVFNSNDWSEIEFHFSPSYCIQIAINRSAMKGQCKHFNILECFLSPFKLIISQTWSFLLLCKDAIIWRLI